MQANFTISVQGPINVYLMYSSASFHCQDNYNQHKVTVNIFTA